MKETVGTRRTMGGDIICTRTRRNGGKKKGEAGERGTGGREEGGNGKEGEKGKKIYKSYFDENKLPARTCIGVTGLAVGASVEIDLIAKQ